MSQIPSRYLETTCATCGYDIRNLTTDKCPECGETFDPTGYGPTLNPWTSIWLRPRATMRYAIRTDPEGMVIMLAAMLGIGATLGSALNAGSGDLASLGTMLLAAIVIGPFVGIFYLYLLGQLLHWTGRWIGGEASRAEIRSAIAWSCIPAIWAMLLWIPKLALVVAEIFIVRMSSVDEWMPMVAATLAFRLTGLTIGIWCVVVFLKCLSEVQNFSAWKALGNILLAGLVIVVPMTCIAWFGMMVSSP